MGREGDRQRDLIVSWAEMPRSPGHVFYDRLQEVLISSRLFTSTVNAFQQIAAGAETILANGTTLAYVVQLGELFLLLPVSRFVLRRSSHCAVPRPPAPAGTIDGACAT